MANKFFVAPSPHVHSAQSTRSIMRDVLIAMLPALAVSTWVHGVDVLTVSAIAVVSCVVIEFLGKAAQSVCGHFQAGSCAQELRRQAHGDCIGLPLHVLRRHL